MERLNSCAKCSPHTEEIFCVENKGIRYKYIIHEDSAPKEMPELIEQCPELAIIEIQEREK